MYDSDGRSPALDILQGAERAFILSVLTAAQDCVELIAPDGTLVHMNPGGRAALGVSDMTSLAGRPWQAHWPASAQPDLSTALATAQTGARADFEAMRPTRSGALRWWLVSVLPVRDTAGVLRCYLASSHDITERVLRDSHSEAEAEALKNALEETSALLEQRDFLQREIDHRVKNSLAQVAAILRLQARRSGDEIRAALEEAAGRIASIARVHEQLQSSKDLRSVRLRPLLERLCAEFSTTHAREIALAPDPEGDLALPPDRASALCIIVSELVANAVRHGRESGRIELALATCPATSGLPPGTARLSVSNPVRTGGQPGEGVAFGAGFGSGLGTMICETYASSLGGTLDWQEEAGVMIAAICFPTTPEGAANNCLR